MQLLFSLESSISFLLSCETAIGVLSGQGFSDTVDLAAVSEML